MNKITITIEGPVGSGKSTLARYVTDILKDDKFGVTLIDDEIVGLMPGYDEERLSHLADCCTIDVITKQTIQLECDSKKTTGEPEYLHTWMGGTYWYPCKIIHALLPPSQLLIWFDPFDDGVGEEKLVASDRIRYV